MVRELQLSKNDISYNEYVLNFGNINHLNFINDCERSFLSLVYAYYNILKIENAEPMLCGVDFAYVREEADELYRWMRDSLRTG